MRFDIGTVICPRAVVNIVQLTLHAYNQIAVKQANNKITLLVIIGQLKFCSRVAQE